MADNRDLGLTRLLRVLRLFRVRGLCWRKRLEHRVQQIIQTAAVFGRNRKHPPNPKPMKFVHPGLLLVRVNFIDCQEQRLAQAQQQVGEFKVGSGEFAASIGDHDDCRSFLKGHSRLAKYLGGNEFMVIRDDAARIDNAQLAPAPLCFAVEPVASDAGFVADNGAPRSDDAVEQRGLAHVGAPHDSKGGNARRCRKAHRIRVDSGQSNGSCAVAGTDSIIEVPVASASQPVVPAKKHGTSLYNFFAPGGVLSQTHPAYEFRRGQLQMAQAVEQALAEKRHLIVEAGTGTGKTLAYLMPVIRSGKRVIISTGTKNLQEQLFYKDVPFLEQALYGNTSSSGEQQTPRGARNDNGKKLSVCYMKGRNNYLCRKKLYDLTDQPVLSGLQEIEQYRAISVWEKTTSTGDRAELAELPEASLLWPKLDARADACTGQKCSQFDRCFVTEMRRRGMESDIIIVNHHLFFADLAIKL